MAMPESDIHERLLTVQEVADIARVAPESVRRWLRQYRDTRGRLGLRGIQFSKRAGWRVRESDLRTFMDERTNDANEW